VQRSDAHAGKRAHPFGVRPFFVGEIRGMYG
jgi:hypothetical protein